jgi:hypothetical protein
MEINAMEAKDTVIIDFVGISPLKIFAKEYPVETYELAKMQAEISFKAGFKEGLVHQYDAYRADHEMALKFDKEAYNKAINTGMKEVIDYIEQRGDLYFNFPFGQITKSEWLNKKKEWGIE